MHLLLLHRWRVSLLGLVLSLLISFLVFSNLALDTLILYPLPWLPIPSNSSHLRIFPFGSTSSGDNDSWIDGQPSVSLLRLAKSKNLRPRGAAVVSSYNEYRRVGDEPAKRSSAPAVEELSQNGFGTSHDEFDPLLVDRVRHELDKSFPEEEGAVLPLSNDLVEAEDTTSPDANYPSRWTNGTLFSEDGSPLLQQPAEYVSKGKSLPFPPPYGSPGHCDISVGRWVQDDAYPLYKPGSCPYIQEKFSCQENGRPDSDYMRWRWKPKDCEIPRFNATNMLERLRGKRLVFVGDSLNRNQGESMLCILREAVANKSRVFEMYRERGAFAFKFLDYNCKLEFYRSNFLVDEEERPGRSRPTLKLDTVDKSESVERKWRGADILIFNTGHWWNHGKTAKGKDFFQEGGEVYPKLRMMVAFRKALSTWAAWVDEHVNPGTTQVFFRSYSPKHFKGGQWNSGGRCRQETQPIDNESFLASYPNRMIVVEEIIQHMKTPVTILNVTRLTDFRKDAHPSVYGHRPGTQAADGYQDCSHWCLPGLPDMWNELLYASFITTGQAV